MIPQMLAVIGQTMEANDEASAKIGFDTLETLLIIEVPLINAHFDQAVQFNCTIGSNKALDESFRNMALNCLLWSIKFKKTKIASLNLIKPIVDALIIIGTEDEPEDPEDDSVARVSLFVFVSYAMYSLLILFYLIFRKDRLSMLGCSCYLSFSPIRFPCSFRPHSRMLP